jgi:hypothetical protein
MADLPLSSNAKRPKFFDGDASDIHTSMLLEIMAELWTVKERLYVLEEVLSNEDDLIKNRVEAYTLSDTQQADLEARRAGFIGNVMRSLEDSTTSGNS